MRTGLKPKDRKLAVKSDKQLTANQWQNTPQQNIFMEAWLSADSPTFGNAYKSALKAGYNERYAAQLASPAINNKWIQEYPKLNKLDLNHIEQKLIKLINGEITRKDSNSPEDTRLKAIEMYGRFTGKLNDKNQVNVTIVQPILGGASRRNDTLRHDDTVIDTVKHTTPPT